jgi:hypothetical protein
VLVVLLVVATKVAMAVILLLVLWQLLKAEEAAVRLAGLYLVAVVVVMV